MQIKLKWGRLIMWSGNKWAIQVSFPYLRWKPHTKELFIDLDCALRISLTEPAFGFQVLGFGLGISFSPALRRYL